MSYQPRVVDGQLAARLQSAGVVLLEGPKACGKTAAARRLAASEVLLDVDSAAMATMAVDPRLVLDGPPPRLVDEWQLAADDVWNHVRRLVDERQQPGQFILTGSATPDDDARRHSGAGRFSVLRMRPMSLSESGHSNGHVSLAALMAGQPPRCPDPGLRLEALIDAVCVGGWPANLTRSVPAALQANRDYLANVRDVDVSRVGAAIRDPLRVGRFLQSLARNVATEAGIALLCRDAGSPDEPLARSTGYEYLDVLSRLMVLEDQPAWSVHLRSKATLRQHPKRHFVDPSLAVAALAASPQRLLADLKAFGCLFESLVVRDLRVLAQPLDGQLFHYRDSDGLEVDVVVALPDGRWAGLEVKLGLGDVEQAATNLTRFAARVDTSRTGPPAALVVVTGSGYGYQRPDGVCVVPVGALGA